MDTFSGKETVEKGIRQTVNDPRAEIQQWPTNFDWLTPIDCCSFFLLQTAHRIPSGINTTWVTMCT